MIPQVVASERGEAQTVIFILRGCRTNISDTHHRRIVVENAAAEGESPVFKTMCKVVRILSKAGPVESCLNQPAPSGKAKYS
jgi:hypothetical protein